MRRTSIDSGGAVTIDSGWRYEWRIVYILWFLENQKPVTWYVGGGGVYLQTIHVVGLLLIRRF